MEERTLLSESAVRSQAQRLEVFVRQKCMGRVHACKCVQHNVVMSVRMDNLPRWCGIPCSSYPFGLPGVSTSFSSHTTAAFLITVFFCVSLYSDRP